MNFIIISIQNISCTDSLPFRHRKSLCVKALISLNFLYNWLTKDKRPNNMLHFLKTFSNTEIYYSVQKVQSYLTEKCPPPSKESSV